MIGPRRPQRQKAPDPRILDLAHLRRYTQGNAELEAELIGLFKGQIPGLLAQIRDAVEAEWKLAVHTLKGSARAVGAVEIGEIAVRLENAGHSAPAETRDGLVARLERAVADFDKEAEKLIS
jgi:HPt (histidine-containing phosphotransfer) domain-containing protein